VAARWCAWAADAEAAISDAEGRGQARRSRTPRLWRSQALHSRVEAVSWPKKRPRRGRPPKAETPEVAVRSRLVVSPEAVVLPEEAPGWTGLATTLRSEGWTDGEILQAYQEQHSTVEPGFRWINNPAASSPVWREQPARMAALALLTVVGLLVYAVMQRQVRLSLRDHHQHIPGHKGPTATPTAAVVFALFTSVRLVRVVVEKTISLQGHGVQDYHLLICEAVGIDPAWYHGVVTEQNALPRTTPP
jgi:transposase